MPLFNRRKDNDDEDGDERKKETKGAWRRPANTAFKQQRLKAWQPILTPKTVLPILFIIGIIFGPIGGLLIYGSSQVSQITLEYTNCENAGANFTSTTQATFQNLPFYYYQLKAGDDKLAFNPPQWSYKFDNAAPAGQKSQCLIRFELPADLPAPVFIYYRLTNFYQNHRRYVQSLDADQLLGTAVRDLSNSNCRPKATRDGKPVYPCGLIADSLFNDTIGNPVLSGSTTTYEFSDKGIAWPGEKKKYGPTQYKFNEVVPPNGWMERYPGGYEEGKLPDFSQDEHFQNWMRTAGLPTFSKLYGRNDNAPMLKGTYEILVSDNFPVTKFSGTKAIVISTVSWIGGKNPFLGWAYVAAAGLFVLLGLIGLAWHLIKPRRLGDMSLLSWNQPGSGPSGR